VLTVPFLPLAEGIAEEWQGLSETFGPDDLPMTRLIATAQDRIRYDREQVIGRLAGYGMNDLLCYRAGGAPELAACEADAWQPWLDWAEQTFGVCWRTTTGVMPVVQTPENFARFTAVLRDMDEYQLAGLGVVVPGLGSLVLGLALQAGLLAPEAACDCANLDELWQESHWGADEAAEARRRADVKDIAVSARFMILCRP
jgi:chaperone required for assembly of F1-ATPase